MDSILKVTEVGQINDNKNGNGKNQKITVQEFKIVNLRGGAIEVATAKTATRVIHKGVKNTQGEDIKTKDQIFFGILAPGMPVMGEINNFRTTQYEINGRYVNSFTSFSFEGEDAIKVANSQLKAKGAVVVIGDELTASIPQGATVVETE